MEIETTEIEIDFTRQKIIAGPVNNLEFILIINDSREVSMYNLQGIKIESKILEKQEFRVTSIYVDDIYLYCGFTDGTMEILDIYDELSTIKITSDRDPGGPGQSDILEIYSSESYVFVRTVENGILIYDRYSLEFFKWIMIDTAFTVLKSSSYKRQLFFVLTKEDHVHVLDFDEEKLFPLNIKTDEYIDLEFDGRFLIMATKNRVKIHNPSKNFKIIFKHELETSEIQQISILGQFLIISTLDNTILEINLTDMIVDPPQQIESTKLIHKVKRDFFLQNKDIRSLGFKFPIVWRQNDHCYLSQIHL